MHGRIEYPNTSYQAVELNLSFSGQAHTNRPGTGPGNKNMELGSILTVLCVPLIIFPLRSVDAKSGKVVKRFGAAGANERLDLSFSLRAYEDPLKDHTRYDRGPEIQGAPRRVSLPVGKAQLAGCLKVCLSGPLEWDAGIQ